MSPVRFIGQNARVTTFTDTDHRQTPIAIQRIQPNKRTWKNTMNLLMLPSRNFGSLLLLPLLAAAGEQGPITAKQTAKSELERIVGNRIENPVEVISWKANKPQQTNLVIYSVKPPKLDEALLLRVAERFSLTGEVKRITGETLGHVGYSIKESNPIVPSKPRSVFFWSTMGNFGYDTGDDGYRFNRVTKQHEIRGVFDKEEAKQEA